MRPGGDTADGGDFGGDGGNFGGDFGGDSAVATSAGSSQHDRAAIAATASPD
jgi:hypothetical protein